MSGGNITKTTLSKKINNIEKSHTMHNEKTHAQIKQFH